MKEKLKSKRPSAVTDDSDRHPFTARVTDAAYKSLRHLSVEREVPLQQLIDEALVLYFSQKSKAAGDALRAADPLVNLSPNERRQILMALSLIRSTNAEARGILFALLRHWQRFAGGDSREPASRFARNPGAAAKKAGRKTAGRKKTAVKVKSAGAVASSAAA